MSFGRENDITLTTPITLITQNSRGAAGRPGPPDW